MKKRILENCSWSEHHKISWVTLLGEDSVQQGCVLHCLSLEKVSLKNKRVSLRMGKRFCAESVRNIF